MLVLLFRKCLLSLNAISIYSFACLFVYHFWIGDWMLMIVIGVGVWIAHCAKQTQKNLFTSISNPMQCDWKLQIKQIPLHFAHLKTEEKTKCKWRCWGQNRRVQWIEWKTENTMALFDVDKEAANTREFEENKDITSHAHTWAHDPWIANNANKNRIRQPRTHLHSSRCGSIRVFYAVCSSFAVIWWSIGHIWNWTRHPISNDSIFACLWIQMTAHWSNNLPRCRCSLGSMNGFYCKQTFNSNFARACPIAIYVYRDSVISSFRFVFPFASHFSLFSRISNFPRSIYSIASHHTIEQKHTLIIRTHKHNRNVARDTEMRYTPKSGDRLSVWAMFNENSLTRLNW